LTGPSKYSALDESTVTLLPPRPLATRLPPPKENVDVSVRWNVPPVNVKPPPLAAIAPLDPVNIPPCK
jgi:hypothetical protein